MDFTLYNPHLKALLVWLLPKTCRLCGKKLEDRTSLTSISDSGCYSCSSCIESLPYLKHCCFQCGQPFSGGNKDIDRCGKCLSSPPPFDQCFSPFEYAPPISDQICQLKYGQQAMTAKFLADLFVQEWLAHDIELPDALISVPMHPKRLRERGFNQSSELAKQLSKQLNIPFIRNALKKKKHTPQQAQQTLLQRQANLKNSFICTKGLNYQHVAIIDDVVTTGATVREISKILRKKGVDYIQVWSITRTR